METTWLSPRIKENDICFIKMYIDHERFKVPHCSLKLKNLYEWLSHSQYTQSSGYQSMRTAQLGALVGQGRTDAVSVLVTRALVRRCFSLLRPFKWASSSFDLMFLSLVRSHVSFLVFLGFGPLVESGSSISLSSDDIKSIAFGEDRISFALSLSFSDRVLFCRLWRRLDSF